ncbi:hypothetical protein CORC01_01534 [Colletotrichum orchidophilum]|uniref:Uncharacterized protein n=1 Tax=Colletotrichum orchidophilum TaxID=1209926 RepID=A0A1G4BNW8_9PEZI|nr:uncharacterized protein CORC01_01534 [Colletotrichum orchidophilum]OHF03150.1 hypothetical protein CORC01_01534 [Colletotrichum orchidophilum]
MMQRISQTWKTAMLLECRWTNSPTRLTSEGSIDKRRPRVKPRSPCLTHLRIRDKSAVRASTSRWTHFWCT